MKEGTEDLAGLGACRSESRSQAAGTESVGARPGRHRQGTLSSRPQGAGHEEPTRGLSFPFCFVDPNPSGIQFTGGGFLPTALRDPHGTDARDALTASPHVRSVLTCPVHTGLRACTAKNYSSRRLRFAKAKAPEPCSVPEDVQKDRERHAHHRPFPGRSRCSPE